MSARSPLLPPLIALSPINPFQCLLLLLSGGGGAGYAVVINTWKRYDLLRRSVAHYSGCGGVDAVHVVWSEPEEPTEELRGSVLNCSDGGGAGVRFVINAEDSLNNRFRPIQGLTTDAIFSVDDDLIVPCSTLQFAFAMWNRLYLFLIML